VIGAAALPAKLWAKDNEGPGATFVFSISRAAGTMSDTAAFAR